MAVIQGYYLVGGLVVAFVVVSGGTHECKVHEEFSTTCGDLFSRALSGLFADVGLCFKIDGTDGVILKYGRRARVIQRQHVQLVFARGSKSQQPHFQFYLTGLRSWEIPWGRPPNVHGAWYMSPTTQYADRIVVDGENVC